MLALTESKGMTGLEIKIELWRKGVKLVDIASSAGVTLSAVSRALRDNDEYMGRRLRPFIATALGLPEDKIWPSEKRQRLA